MTKPTVRDAAKELAHLYVFAAVVGALENGTISGTASKDADKIINLCKAAQQKCLARYDAIVKAMNHDQV
jgi:hypothetical protein